MSAPIRAGKSLASVSSWREDRMSGIVRLLAMLVVCFGVVGLASAAVGEEYPKQTIPTPPIPTPQTIPTPQAIPHEHEHGCEGHREHDGWRGKPAYGCDEARAECGDAHRCRAEAEKGPGKHHAAMGRCCGDRGGEDACASAKDDRDDDRDAYKSAEFPPKPGLKISQFVLYGERSVHLGDCDRVRGGDVGVRSFAEKSQDSQLRIGRDSFVEVSRLVVAPSVAVAHGVTLGPVAADQFRDDGIPLGTLAGFPASGMPPLPLAVGGGGGPDVSVGHDQALALLPGHYGTLTVQGVLLLNPGWYSVGKVQVGDHGRIVAITGDVRLDVAGTLTVGRHAAVYADFDLPARQFRISVAGFDADDTPAASIGEFSMMRALLAAPHGTLGLADYVRATGAFAAF